MKKRCQRCGKPAKGICDRCFVKLAERRMARELHAQAVSNDCVIGADELSQRALLRLFRHRGKYRPIIRLISGDHRYLIEATSESIDDELDLFLQKWLGGGFKGEKEDINIKPFRELTDEELQRYCKHIRGVFTRRKGSYKAGLDTLEGKYPGTKHSFIKASRTIRSICG